MAAATPRPRPALTIVIPTLNRAHVVAHAVESALAQTSDEIEIIVSDNGSTDGTEAVLNAYRDPRLRRIRHDRTLSPSAHGNLLINEASGEFFLGLSDDDWIEPDFAARVLDLLRRRPDLAFVYTGCMTHYGDVSVPSLTGPETERGTEFIAGFFAGEREVCWCACVTRVADLRAIGPIPEGRVFGDMFYWTKLAFLGDVGCVETPLSHYAFMTADNISSATPVAKWARETRMIADDVLAAFGDSCNNPRASEGLRRNCARFVARSTANQFIWSAIRGSTKRALVAVLPACVPFVAGDRAVWPRMVSALLLPRRLMKALVLKAAARRAHARENR